MFVTNKKPRLLLLRAAHVRDLLRHHPSFLRSTAPHRPSPPRPSFPVLYSSPHLATLTSLRCDGSCSSLCEGSADDDPTPHSLPPYPPPPPCVLCSGDVARPASPPPSASRASPLPSLPPSQQPSQQPSPQQASPSLLPSQ